MNQPQLEIMKKYNKVIVQKSSTFYSKAQHNRKKLFYDESKHKVFVINWYNIIVELVQNSNKL